MPLPLLSNLRAIRGRDVVFGVAFAALFTLLALAAKQFAPALIALDHFAGDLRTSWLSDEAKEQHRELAVVLIDDETLSRYADHPYRSPVDRGVVARLVTALDRAGARAIGLDFLYVRPTEKAKDEALIAAIKGAKARIVLGAADERTPLPPNERKYMEDYLARAAGNAPIGYLNLRYDHDRVMRYLPRPSSPLSPYQQSFADLLADGVGKRAKPASWHRPLPALANAAPTHRVAWLREPANGEDLFRLISAKTLLEAAGDPAGQAALLVRTLVQGRTVLIGGDFPDLDRHSTPFNINAFQQTAGVILHAQMAAQFMDGRSKLLLPWWSETPIIFFFACLGFAAGRLLRLDKSLYIVGSAVLIGLDLLLFRFADTVVPFTLPMMAWLAGALLGNNLEAVLRFFRISDTRRSVSEGVS